MALAGDRQGGDEDAAVGAELEMMEAAEGAGVLVLAADTLFDEILFDVDGLGGEGFVADHFAFEGVRGL